MNNNNTPKTIFPIIFFLLLIVYSLPSAEHARYTPNAGSFFVENAGQWDSQARFLARSAGRDVWISSNGITFDYYRLAGRVINAADSPNHDKMAEIRKDRTGHVIKMNFRGSLGTSAVSGIDKQKAYYNYFIGNNPEKWKSNVGIYSTVKIENLYKNIDAVVYYDGLSVRYDFKLRPGGNPGDIVIEFAGQDKIEVNKQGHLEISTSLGEVQHNSIYAYQLEGGREIPVECSFRQEGKFMKFSLGEYDKSKELIIDPLVYSTFVGPAVNSIDQLGMGMATSGNAVYLTGTASSAGFPVTAGAYSNGVSISNNYHVFVSKIIPDKSLPAGQQLVFSTFFGGKENDFGYDIVLDKDNDIYLTGTTSSADFPITANTFDKNGGWNDILNKKIGDGFIAKLSADGKNLNYSTFIGEDRYFYTTSIDVDANKMVYVTGYSNCTFFKPSQNAGYFVNRGEGTDWDIIMLKLDLSAGTNGLLYFSFYGGNQHDEGYKIKAFDNGSIYITGQSKSPNFPVTSGTAPANAIPDVFVLKMDFSKSGAESRLNSLIFGGSDIDIAYDMAADNSENLYITGYTVSKNFPVTAEAFYNTNNGDKDIFLSKVDFTKPDPLIFSSYLGGKQGDIAYSIAIDNISNIFLTGSTSSTNYPTTAGAFGKQLSGQSDAVITKVKLLGDPPYSVSYSSYMGGTNDEAGVAIGFMADQGVALAGITKSEDFPVSLRAFNNTGFKDTNTVFLTKLDVINDPLSFDVDLDTVICSDNPANIGIKGEISGGSGNYSYSWFPVDYLDNPFVKNPALLVQTDTVRILYYYLEVKDNTTGVTDEKRIKITVMPSPKPVINETGNKIFCMGKDLITYTTTPANGVTCEWQATNCTPAGNPPYTGNSISVVFNKAGTAKIKLVQIFTATKCSNFTEMDITVNPTPDAKIFGDAEVCSGCDAGYSTQQADTLGYKWSAENGVIKNGADNKNTVDITWNDVGEGGGKVTLIVTNIKTGCSDTAQLDIKITALPKPTILGEVSVCTGDTVTYSTPQKPEAVNKWKATGGLLIGPDNGLEAKVLWNASGAAKIELNQKIQSKNYDETTEMPVTIHDRPNPGITGANTTGIGDLVRYSVANNPDFEYQWLLVPAGMGVIKSASEYETDITWAAPGTARLIVVVTNQFGCIGTDTLIVNINSNIIKVSGPADACEGEEYTYSTNSFSNASISWAAVNGNIITGQGTNTVTVQWNLTGNASVKATHTFTAEGTKAETSLGVTVNPKPAKPVITRAGASLEKLVSSSATGNQWYKEGVIITGANGQEYIPEGASTANYTVRVKNQFGCEIESEPFTFGPIKTTAELLIRANPAIATDGEKVNIEIVIINPKELNDVNAAKSIGIQLIMKAGILIPNDTKYIGTKSGEDRIVQMNIPIPANAASGQVLSSFSCTAVLDAFESTEIAPAAITPAGGMITFTNVTKGEFILANVCHEGGKPRLVNSSGKLELLNIAPNPAGNSFEAEFETIENGMHRLYLVNSMGTAEYPLMSAELKKGRYMQLFSTEGIPSGAYVLIFETPYTSKNVKINITK